MIAVRDLVFSYSTSADPVVRGLTFDVAPGEIFGLLGPSGAGKSTTQKILIGLLAGYEGSASVLGTELAGWRPADYERIGVAFEAPTHFLKLTGRENLALFARFYRRSARDPRPLLEELGLADAADQPVSRYSKGMKTRLGVARALLHDPELLFLDEPTVGLDPVSGRVIRGLIRRERDAGKTVFLTTHDMAVADDLCDRIALIDDGLFRAVDAPRALKLAHGKRRVRVEVREDGALRAHEFPLDGLGDDPRFAALLREAAVETIHSEEASLEDVFVALTGRTLA